MAAHMSLISWQMTWALVAKSRRWLLVLLDSYFPEVIAPTHVDAGGREQVEAWESTRNLQVVIEAVALHTYMHVFISKIPYKADNQISTIDQLGLLTGA